MTDYDLIKRTLEFSKASIKLAKKIPANHISKPIITQFVKSTTSIGANYCEANNAESNADFRHKIAISRKEAQESSYWLEIMKSSFDKYVEEIDILLKESIEINLILSKILRNNANK